MTKDRAEARLLKRTQRKILQKKMKIKYEFPKKWCVERTLENAEILNNWANSQEDVGHSSKDGFIHSHNLDFNGWTGNGHYYADEAPHPEFTLISFEDFKKYVLNGFIEPEEDISENHDYLIPLLTNII